MTPRRRLALLAVVVTATPLVLALTGVVSASGLRAVVERTGPAAPLAYVLLGTLLGVLLAPGPVLAATSGLLFGPFTGTVVTVTSATLTAVITCLLGRRAGRAGATEVLGARAAAVARLVKRDGTVVVIVQRLAPGVPDGPVSYAFGALGVRVRQIAVGTVVGTLPRAFSYTAIGASLQDPTSPLAVAGLVGVVVTSVLGAVLVRRLWTRARTS